MKAKKCTCKVAEKVLEALTSRLAESAKLAKCAPAGHYRLGYESGLAEAVSLLEQELVELRNKIVSNV